ncbi:alpha-beta hydrolase superfamily lysophospholipase [Microbacterium phyllosphaerae]|uniref:Alpha-beta hydrolase superfamily lysophospholipase n=1 Tax=Microbacterium phyllosphaerae TaxID=124798 RepID=A0ABS4WUX0_9MICO|nr:alpha/beta hydrolase [Microbacterium phyllosphaerae]MBP2379999.1 alpha-beta hydrolase superfamily lysophospholipase [Microbacterium phyllosphaerae]MCS3444673.1 alpha-beta hydrolase superfamily lysophospholipase [Microbacterium phyllosphaerae]
MTDTREFTDADGIAIVYDVHEAEGDARGVVQLLHGVGEHAGRYGALIAALTGAGFHVYADDHRGHGRTGIRQHGGPAKLGRLGKGGLMAAKDAVWQLTGIIKDEHPDLPLVLLGHSWGSFLAQMLVNDHPEAWDAVILSGSALRMPGSLNAAPLNARWAGPEATGLEWLSRDPAVWKAFDEDPLTTDVPLLKLFGPIEAAKLYGRPRKDLGRDIPMLLLVGRDDSVGGPRSVHKLADEYRTRSGLTDITTLVYPDARHEIFAELQQDEVRADVLSWLDTHIPAR